MVIGDAAAEGAGIVGREKRAADGIGMHGEIYIGGVGGDELCGFVRRLE